MERNSVLNETLTFCAVELEMIAQKVVQNAEDMPNEIISTWSEQLKAVSLAVATSQVRAEVFRAEIQELKNSRGVPPAQPSSSSSSSSPSGGESFLSLAAVKDRICKRCNDQKANDSQSYKKICGILSPEDESDDVDIRVVNRVETEADFKCPYSGMKFVEPMKKYALLVISFFLF